MSKGCIYFISWEDDLDHMKIGFSARLSKRFSDFLICNWRSLVVRKVISAPLGKETEAMLHQKFARSRVAGEWFKVDDELLSFLRSESDDLTLDAQKRLASARIEWNIVYGPKEARKLRRRETANGIKSARHYVLWLMSECEKEGMVFVPARAIKNTTNAGLFKQQTIYNELSSLRQREMIGMNENGEWRLTIFGKKELERLSCPF